MGSFLKTVIVLQFLIVLYCSKKIDFCKLDCNGVNHTICQYGCKPNKSLRILLPDFTFRNHALHYHNYYRNKVGTGKITINGNAEAANLNALNYDLELELTAMCWIYYLGDMEHDKCRGTPTFRFAGQNLAIGAYDMQFEENMKLPLGYWFDEYKILEPDQIDNFHLVKGRKTGHYTQMLWAETTHVGCAYCTVDGVFEGSMTRRSLVACNYGPNGNILGEKVYIKGKGASKCPKGKKQNSQFPGLCGEIAPLSGPETLIGNPDYDDLRCPSYPTPKPSHSNLLEPFAIYYSCLIFIWLLITGDF